MARYSWQHPGSSNGRPGPKFRREQQLWLICSWSVFLLCEGLPTSHTGPIERSPLDFFALSSVGEVQKQERRRGYLRSIARAGSGDLRTTSPPSILLCDPGVVSCLYANGVGYQSPGLIALRSTLGGRTWKLALRQRRYIILRIVRIRVCHYEMAWSVTDHSRCNTFGVNAICRALPRVRSLTLTTLGFDMQRRWRKGDLTAPMKPLFYGVS